MPRVAASSGVWLQDRGGSDRAEAPASGTGIAMQSMFGTAWNPGTRRTWPQPISRSVSFEDSASWQRLFMNMPMKNNCEWLILITAGCGQILGCFYYSVSKSCLSWETLKLLAIGRLCDTKALGTGRGNGWRWRWLNGYFWCFMVCLLHQKWAERMSTPIWKDCVSVLAFFFLAFLLPYLATIVQQCFNVCQLLE